MIGIGTEPLQLASTLFALYKSSLCVPDRDGNLEKTKTGGGVATDDDEVLEQERNTESESGLGLRWITMGKVKLVYQEEAFSSSSCT
mgnify:CR=1 FL=1